MGQLKKTVYKPDTGVDDLLLIIRDFTKNLPQSFNLGYRLALRNIRAKYRQSLFGILWVLLPPLATSGVWIFLRSQNIFDFKGLSVPYPVFVLTGTLLWQVFSESITILLDNLNHNRSLLTKINFPHESLVFSAVCEIFFAIFVKLILLAAVLIIFQILPGWQFVFTILGIFALMLLGLTIGLMLIPFAMLYKDISLGLPFILQFAIYLTPVVYPLPDYKGIGKILAYNPVTPLLTNSREWLFGLSPNSTVFIWIIFLSLLMMIAGLLLYKLSMQIIIERIGS